MRKLFKSGKYKKDLKKAIKQNKDLTLLTPVLRHLLHQKKLPDTYRDHALIGNHIGCRECHLEPDWLLMYRERDEGVYLLRLGSHSEIL